MSEIQKTAEEITAYETVNSGFDDYTRFAGDVDARNAQKSAFIGGFEYIPTYENQRLRFFIDEEKIRDKKTHVQEAIMELEVAKQNPENNAAEIELYMQAHEYRLKKIFLVEAARGLMTADNSAARETARETFMAMSQEVYGEIDAELYKGMVATEAATLHAFEPSTRQATLIKNELQFVYDRLSLGDTHEQELLDHETFKILHDAFVERFGDTLAVVPETGEDVYYDAQDIVGFVNQALVVSGLADKGWEGVIDPKRTRAAAGDKKVKLPPTMHRNADAVRTLIAHEIDDHAQREQNGEDLGMRILKNGTAAAPDVEEGLGSLFGALARDEFDPSVFKRARDNYLTAGLATGLDSGPRDARETYEILWRMIAVREAKHGAIHEGDILDAKDRAYNHVENAFRGTPFYMKGVIFPRLKVYYENVVTNIEYFTDAIKKGTLDEAFDTAMLGKSNHTDSAEVDLVRHMIKNKKGKDQGVMI